LARPQDVQAHARDDGCQPSTEVVDLLGIGAAQSQPGFLNGIVHVAQRAQHPIRHGAQAGSVFFESLGQVVVFVHRSHFLDVFRQ